MTVESRAQARHLGWVFAARWRGDPVMTPLLLGLGLDELSVAPPSVPQIKYPHPPREDE